MHPRCIMWISDDFYQLLTKLKFRLPAACIGSTVHPRCIMWFSGQLFFFSA